MQLARQSLGSVLPQPLSTTVLIAMATQMLALKVTLIYCCIRVALTQRLPANNCGNLFRYERQGDSWIGHVTPTQDGLTDVTWSLRFSSHGDEPGTVSSLSPYPDKDTALQRMIDGGRGESFVTFDNYQTELPKIVRIELNDQVLCTASEYGAPSRTSTRTLNMAVSSRSTGPAPAITYEEARPAPSTRRTTSSCGDVFEYRRQGNEWIGHVTSPQNGLRDINWTVRFSARGVDKPGEVSSLAPFPDKDTALQRLLNGGRSEAFVLFNDYQVELPKVVHVELNGQVLCSSSEYGAPSVTLTRQLHSTVSGGGEYRPNKATTERTRITVNTPVDFDECGVEGFTGLQYGGENVPRGRFPWLAALYHDVNLDPVKVELDYKCVTTLISKRTVITAAHCIYGSAPGDLRVYVGRHDTFVHPEKDAMLMSVQSVRTHPDFVGNLVPELDLGLVVLTEQVQFSLYVRPICLWTTSTSLGIGDTELTAVAGWGINQTFSRTRFPMSVNVRPVSREECLRQMITAKDFVTPRTICAGNSNGHGPCLGDSGAGLMVLRNNRWMVRGIVSLAQRAGHGCELTRFVIYCDVAKHLGWIQQNYV